MAYVNVHIKDLNNLNHGTPKVNVICSCGVSHTQLLAEAIPWAFGHVRGHGEGKVHYKGLTRAISVHGHSRPVLGSARFQEPMIRSNHG